jgi:hypothetical protein
LVGFLGFPRGLDLLEGNFDDKNEPCNNALMMLGAKKFEFILIFTLNPMPP